MLLFYYFIFYVIILKLDKNTNTLYSFAYNTAYHSSLQTSSAFLNLGREAKPTNSFRRRAELQNEIETQPLAKWAERMQHIQTLHDWVEHTLGEAFQKQSGYYNLHRRHSVFKVGDLCFKALTDNVIGIATYSG